METAANIIPSAFSRSSFVRPGQPTPDDYGSVYELPECTPPGEARGRFDRELRITGTRTDADCDLELGPRAPNRIPETCAGRSGRFIGHQSVLHTEWKTTPNVTIAGEYVHFETCMRLRQAGGADVDFLTSSVAWKF